MVVVTDSQEDLARNVESDFQTANFLAIIPADIMSTVGNLIIGKSLRGNVKLPAR